MPAGVTVRTVGSIFRPDAMDRAARGAADWTTGQVKHLRDDIREHWPVDSGKTGKRFQAKAYPRKRGATGSVWTSIDQAVIDSIEYGRKPGKMPPSGALLGWMSRHGFAPKSEFLLRRAIGRRGTKGCFAIGSAMARYDASMTGRLLALGRYIEEGAANR